MAIQAHNIETLMNLHAEAIKYSIELQKDGSFDNYKRNTEAMHNANTRFYSFANNLIESANNFQTK